MQSGQVNASELMAAFLGSVKDNLGQKIVNNDFTGELEKHLPKQLTTDATTGLEGTGKTDGANEDSKASATGSSVTSQNGTGGSPSVGSATSGAKTKVGDSRAEEKKSLFVSDPAVLETILANLHYPATTRDQCQQLLGKKGRLSIQDLDSILSTRPDSGSTTGGEVPAESVSALLESVVKDSGNQQGNALALGNNVQSSIAVKSGGSYTRDELRSLLGKVVDASQKNSRKTKTSALASSTSSVVETNPPEGLQSGQTQELVATVLPSFISGGRKVSPQPVLDANTGDNQRESKKASINGTDSPDNQAKGVSGAESGSLAGVSAGDTGSSSVNGTAVAAGIAPAGQGTQTVSSGASAAAGVHAMEDEATVTAAVGLDVASELSDLIKSGMGTARGGSSALGATTGVDSPKEVEGRAQVVVQDAPGLGKHIEQLAGGRTQSSENVVLQTTGANTDDNLITPPQMENSSGDGFAFYDKNRMSQSGEQSRGSKTAGGSAANPGGEGIPNILFSYTSSNNGTGSVSGVLSRDSVGQAVSDKTARVAADSGQTSSAGDGQSSGASVANSAAAAVSAKSGTKGLTDVDQLLFMSQGVAFAANVKDATGGSAQNISDLANFVGQAVSDKTARVAADSGQTPPSGEGQSSGASVDNSAATTVSAKTGTEGLTDADQLLFMSQGVAFAANMKDATGGSAQNISDRANSVGLEGSDKTTRVAADSGQTPPAGEGQSSGASVDNSAATTVSAKTGTEGLTAIDQLLSMSQGAAVAAKMKKSTGGSVQNVSGSAKSDGQTVSDKTAQVAGDSGRTLQSAQAGGSGAGNSSSTASASASPLAQQEAASMAANVTDQSSPSGDEQSAGSPGSSMDNNVAASASVKADTDKVASVEQFVVGTQGGGVAAKRVEDLAATSDPVAGAQGVQAAASNLQTINMHPADNSPQNGSGMYDPYRAVELVNDMREQAAGGAGHSLVLDMVSDGLGKVNLKVEARKDEISVEALTQNEPARQALMNHSVELRQDLRNQGLVLGKFMVDVNGGGVGQGGKDSSGAGNHGQSAGRGRGASRMSDVSIVKTSEAPVQAAPQTVRSRISFFA